MSPLDIIGPAALAALEQAGYRVVAVELEIGPSEFDAFWRLYPNKTGKPVAEKSYRAARRRGATQQQITAGLSRYIQLVETDVGRKWLNPATFLNQARYDDEPAAVPAQRTMADLYASRMEPPANDLPHQRQRIGGPVLNLGPPRQR